MEYTFKSSGRLILSYTNMKLTRSVFKFLLIVTIFTCAVDASIRFKEGSITPSNGTALTDDSTQTCAAFGQDEQSTTPHYSQFRVDVPFEDRDETDVTLIGTNLRCDGNLHLTPISSAESEKWTGRWRKCSLLEMTATGDTENCLYKCNCSEGCDEMQILRVPFTVEQSSWTLCHIGFGFEGCREAPKNRSGVYSVKVSSDENVPFYTDVYCDMVTDGGGWTVIVRRTDGSVDFQKEWEDYKLGFGSLNGEFWAGNELIHRLTSDGRTYSVRFDLEAYDGDKIYIIYNDFSVGPESDNYTLHVSGYNNDSTGGDSFTYNNNMMFSTPDRDNDRYSRNCAMIRSPWWNNACSRCFLNGRYGEYPTVEENVGIKWENDWGTTKFAKYATMMIRPN